MLHCRIFKKPSYLFIKLLNIAGVINASIHAVIYEVRCCPCCIAGNHRTAAVHGLV